MCGRDLVHLLFSQHARFPVVLKHQFCHVGVVGAHHQDVLVRKIFQTLPLHQKLRRVSDFEIGVAFVIGLCCARNDGALDDGREALREGVEDALHNRGIAGPRFGVRGRWHGDVGHVDVINDIGKGCSTSRVVNKQLVCVRETVLDCPADHACSNDAYFHVHRSVHR